MPGLLFDSWDEVRDLLKLAFPQMMQVDVRYLGGPRETWITRRSGKENFVGKSTWEV